MNWRVIARDLAWSITGDKHDRQQALALDRYDKAVMMENNQRTPTWVDETAVVPDSREYTELELKIAGLLSTLPPFNSFHPAWALPQARIIVQSFEKELTHREE